MIHLNYYKCINICIWISTSHECRWRRSRPWWGNNMNVELAKKNNKSEIQMRERKPIYIHTHTNTWAWMYIYIVMHVWNQWWFGHACKCLLLPASTMCIFKTLTNWQFKKNLSTHSKYPCNLFSLSLLAPAKLELEKNKYGLNHIYMCIGRNYHWSSYLARFAFFLFVIMVILACNDFQKEIHTKNNNTHTNITFHRNSWSRFAISIYKYAL